MFHKLTYSIKRTISYIKIIYLNRDFYDKHRKIQ